MKTLLLITKHGLQQIHASPMMLLNSLRQQSMNTFKQESVDYRKGTDYISNNEEMIINIINESKDTIDVIVLEAIKCAVVVNPFIKAETFFIEKNLLNKTLHSKNVSFKTHYFISSIGDNVDDAFASSETVELFSRTDVAVHEVSLNTPYLSTLDSLTLLTVNK